MLTFFKGYKYDHEKSETECSSTSSIHINKFIVFIVNEERDIKNGKRLKEDLKN